MKCGPLAFWVILLTVTTSVGCSKDPGRPVNHDPVMTSLTVFPTDIGPADSAVVTCIATDQDGDTLVYDWETDLRLRIRGNPPGDPTRFNTFNSSEVFYLNYLPVGTDTVWVVGGVRDRRGGEALRIVTFTVHP